MVTKQVSGMGRRKIEIECIDNLRQRNITYLKRKSGLFKKATELSILCDAEVAVIIFSAHNKLAVYSSSTADTLIERFKEHTGTREVIFTYIQSMNHNHDA